MLMVINMIWLYSIPWKCCKVGNV